MCECVLPLRRVTPEARLSVSRVTVYREATLNPPISTVWHRLCDAPVTDLIAGSVERAEQVLTMGPSGYS
jgi:hypothetical protein